MNRHKINRICAIAPFFLSLIACAWVLGDVVVGGQSGGDEGLGFHIFWLLIMAQMMFVVGYVATAEWKHWPKAAGRIALQIAALVLAFGPVAYFKL